MGEIKINDDAQWKTVSSPCYVFSIRTPPLDFSHIVGLVEEERTEVLRWMWQKEPMCEGPRLDMIALRKNLERIPDGSTILIYGYKVYEGDNDSYALHTSKEFEEEARKKKDDQESLHQQLDGVVAKKKLVVVFYDHLMGPIPLSRWDPDNLPERRVSGKVSGLLKSVEDQRPAPPSPAQKQP